MTMFYTCVLVALLVIFALMKLWTMATFVVCAIVVYAALWLIDGESEVTMFYTCVLVALLAIFALMKLWTLAIFVACAIVVYAALWLIDVLTKAEKGDDYGDWP